MPDRLANLATTMTALAEQMAEVRDTLDATARAQERRSAVLRRQTITATGIACLATVAVIVVLVLLIGAIGELRDQQRTLDAKVTADCAFHRDVAALPELVRSVPAPATPSPTAGPVTSALARDSAAAYTLAGCVGVLGELPTVPAPTRRHP